MTLLQFLVLFVMYAGYVKLILDDLQPAPPRYRDLNALNERQIAALLRMAR